MQNTMSLNVLINYNMLSIAFSGMALVFGLRAAIMARGQRLRAIMLLEGLTFPPRL